MPIDNYESEKKTKIIHVISNNGEGIYVNNLLWLQGRYIEYYQWYDLGRSFTSVKFKEIERYWFKGDEELPNYLDKIPNEYLEKMEQY